MATFTVTTLDDTVDANDGKLSLREALTAANANTDADNITFAAALEGGKVTLSQGQLQITNDVTIDADPDQDGTGIVVDANSASRVLLVSGSETDAAIEGLTIQHGHVSGGQDGAGILHEGKSLTIIGCEITGNFAGNYGSYADSVGGAISAQGYLIINSSNIHDNIANKMSGGIVMVDGYISDTVISGNVTGEDYGEGSGGGIHASSVHVVRSAIIDNIASDRLGSKGGGIYANALILEESTVAANKAVSSLADSTGSAIDAVDATIIGSTITQNYSVNRQGNIVHPAAVDVAHLFIDNTIVIGNLASRTTGAPDPALEISSQDLISGGHNLFGMMAGGAVEGDLVNVSPEIVFASSWVWTGTTFVVPLRDALNNPALSGGNPALAGDFDQLGILRPQPSMSNPDIGAYELSQVHISTTPTLGNDVLTVTAGVNVLAGKAGNDLLIGLASADSLKGEAGGDTLQGGLGNDRLDGGTGNDTASYRDATAAVQANLISGTSGGALGADTLVSIENLVGGAFNDSLGGNGARNAIAGLLGNDKLYGDGGDDILRGGRGDDGLWGGLGDDLLDGGAGKDTANYSDATAAVQANLKHGASQGALGNDKLISIENLTGGAYNDSLGGDTGANKLLGGGGNDKLYGDAGNDDLQGQDGNDTLFGFIGDDKLDGGVGIDTASYADITGAGVTVSLALTTAQVTGGGGKDTLLNLENLIGSALADSLTGSSGANTLTGGLGKDMLKGNAGNDLFDFNTAADSVVGVNADWITDFTGAGATVADRIDLADVYAGTLSFKGTGAFTGIGQVRVVGSGSDTIVQVNLSGTTAPEMEIHVQDGASTPGQWVAGDFIL
ncbi:MAG: CSLREA domain-containing protein [Geminicoccaceae bacterium]